MVAHSDPEPRRSRPLTEAHYIPTLSDSIEKRCSKCKETKPVAEFHRRSGTLDGLKYYCKACTPKQRSKGELYRTQHNDAYYMDVLKDLKIKKKCPQCLRLKHCSSFDRAASRPDGFASWCRECKHANPYPDARTQKDRREKDRRRKLGKYGLDEAGYTDLLQRQNGVCAICGSRPGGRSFDIDHCHATGVVRGLLCNPCNVAIGYMRDDPTRLRAAGAYLTRHVQEDES